MKNKKTKSSFEAEIKKLKPQDFDGHTDFGSFSSEQKLIWLSNAARFYFSHNRTKFSITNK
jgi:hypothetical protein